MLKIRSLLIMGAFVFMLSAQASTKALFAKEVPESQFAVLSPWAEADPMLLKGISPRIDTLAGKKIGLFINYKRAARPIGLALEKRLKTMLPSSEILPFYSLEWNVIETETKNKEKFAAWIKNLDAAILLVGD
jgi:hypothetical protein